jgi:hypothetical protein
VADLVKGVLGGGWSLVVGWILPVFLSLQLATALVVPAMAPHLPAVHRFLQESVTARQVTLLAIAAVAGLVLAAAQASLYRVLEGYALWPGPVARYWTQRHRSRRRRLVAKQEKIAKLPDKGVLSGLLYQRAARYPANDKQFAPTMLGNAIRSFETYAGDRYMLDSQLLWNDLTAAAPDSAVTAVGNARTNVDFFVCLFYGSAATALVSLGTGVFARFSAALWLAVGAGLVLSALSYRLAVLATDEWDAAFRAVVDHGRAGVAAAFGLRVPANFDDERLMWRAVNTLVRRPYAYSQAKNVAALIERFRTDPDRAENRAAPGVGAAGAAAVGGDDAAIAPVADIRPASGGPAD